MMLKYRPDEKLKYGSHIALLDYGGTQFFGDLLSHKLYIPVMPCATIISYASSILSAIGRTQQTEKREKMSSLCYAEI